MARELILHVNDREVSRYVTSQMLLRAGFEVREAGSGRECLALAADGVSLVLLDIRLPDLDGYEVCRRLKADPRTASVPVLLSSATLVTTLNKVEGLESGADGYLAQPFEASELVATVRALLRLRRAEQAAKQSEQLARAAVKVRGEFLQVAAHELKTPLTPIQLKLQVLQRQLARADAPPSPDEVLHQVSGVIRQVHRLSALVEGLLDVSRISAGRLRLDLEQVDLCALLEEVVSRYREEAKRVDSALALTLAPGLAGRWDRTRLEQVVSNLLSNALKYGAGAKVSVAAEPTDEGVRITVRDQGIGMSEEMMGRLFGRFERGVSDRNYGGLGLGLYITRQIVEALGGTIHAESRLGAGATFTVLLPLESRAPAPGAEQGEAPDEEQPPEATLPAVGSGSL